MRGALPSEALGGESAGRVCLKVVFAAIRMGRRECEFISVTKMWSVFAMCFYGKF